ncbi:C2H2-type zinc finger protein [Cytobacillus horneckiae]|uniref:Zinc-finger domain-containing protein n=1 Tax=Cytobacillus horneckiae TaxID=549687 RepID=A0A2N0ZKM0_9BACI|nr:zinc-finger domain-containing protein [Cytobacillus horneckiae]NRG47088.1 zinc-finger domain-containing protein [Bacillus sp. CRN 9]MBN6888527.1 zinc-finger domain-containing protein [Cytobacillus horneckiae]MCM3180322.1 zinc-finger domain-containing protein [Cytobacillus horneckiae]MEC1156431.1 zinc-finger domain-containing protein [Cytobacillus horneckiae]MED2938448.1 zinc-finger domain-containing protein [Cytobacillus horneckiae]
MEKKKIVQEVESIMDQYCDECFLYKYHRKEKGRNFAHRFCITQCTVGLKIKSIGKELN